MKYYKIGKVSKLFGVSCETIRNYEKTGLIRSTTPPDSSVRYYDIDNVRKLVGIRTMRNQGFSVSELEQVYSDMSLEASCGALKSGLQSAAARRRKSCACAAAECRRS